LHGLEFLKCKNLDFAPVRERKKKRWTGLGLVKKEKQLDERKLSSFFAKPQKQRCPSYFSSNAKRMQTIKNQFLPGAHVEY
jgi:hypothetical protein